MRFLRANAAKYMIDPDQIGVWGASAGGHLVLLVATSQTHPDYTGPRMKTPGEQLQAVVAWYPPTDMLKMHEMESRAGVSATVRDFVGVDPEQDPERRIQHSEASAKELIKSKVLEALQPHGEIGQPSVAIFGPDSAKLDGPSKRYIDRLADTLRPRARQLLILEGHALDAGPAHSGDNSWLAYTRAEAVRNYLIEQHNYLPSRVESRAWLREIEGPSVGTRSVDARLISPKPDSKK